MHPTRASTISLKLCPPHPTSPEYFIFLLTFIFVIAVLFVVLDFFLAFFLSIRTYTHTHAEPQRAVSYLSIGDPSLCFVRKAKCYRIVFQFHRCNKWWYNTCGEPCIPALTPFLSCTSRSCIFNVRSLPTYDAELCYYSFPFVYLPMTADKCYSSCSNIAAISAITRISHESIVPRIRSST